MSEIIDLYIAYMKAAILGMLLTGVFSVAYGMLASGHTIELTLVLFGIYLVLKQWQRRVMQRSAELERQRMALHNEEKIKSQEYLKAKLRQ